MILYLPTKHQRVIVLLLSLDSLGVLKTALTFLLPPSDCN